MKYLEPSYYTCPRWEVSKKKKKKRGGADIFVQEEAEYNPAARRAEHDKITNLINKINIAALIY